MSANNNGKDPNFLERYTTKILIGLSLLAGLGAVIRILFGGKSILDRIDQTTLLYIGVAAALLLFRNVKSLAFGDYKVEFSEKIKEIKAEVEKADAKAEEAIESAKVAEDAVNFTPGRGSVETHSSEIHATYHVPPDSGEYKDITPGEYEDDPWKGAFGGKSEANERKLSASVTELKYSPGYYLIKLSVVSISPKHHPLLGSVRFFLHPTFNNDTPVVPVQPDGKAALNLKAWGAFTVGVLADSGDTKLELDLSELQDAPYEFTTR